MRHQHTIATLFIITIMLLVGCTTQKKKGDLSPLAKFYHNTTAKYNGYFNANELYMASKEQLKEQFEENYNKILPIYPYEANKNPKAQATNLDAAIEKVSVVVNLHRESHWTDDCYLLMAKAQYLKQDYESTEETLEYMVEEFSPEKLNEQAAQAAKKRNSKNKKKVAVEKKKNKKERVKVQKKKRKKAKKKRKKKKKSQAKKRKKSKKKGGKKSSAKEDKVADAPKTEKKSKKKEDLKNKIEAPTEEPDNYFLKHRPAYQEGQLWLARTYIMRDKFEMANRIFTTLENKGGTYDDIEVELAVAKANFYMQQKEYSQAITPLNEAIEKSKDREMKARMAFIVAQIHQRNGNSTEAYAGFERVLKYGPKYEMEFRSRLNLTQSAWVNGNATAEQAMKELEKMLKDIKNEDFQDQIYYAMANVALKNGDKKTGIKYLEQSLATSSKNPSQKAEAYLQLAELYYEDENYVSAKSYYDSTAQVLPEGDERALEVGRYANSLTDIAKNIETIELQDSLLRISAMSLDEKKALALKIKKEQDEANRKALAQKASANTNTTGGLSRAGNRNVVGSRPSSAVAKSDFFAYDDRSLRRGKQDFNRRWGADRKLEDNWRRSNKRSDLDGVIDEEGEAVVEVSNNVLTDQEIIKYLGNYPQTPQAIKAANKQIADAMYSLGTLFRDRIENNAKSVETLEKLLRTYPNTEHELEAWYYLYIAHKDLGNPTQANSYRDKIIAKYPDTTYGRVLTDPNFLVNMENERNQLTNYYDRTYDKFSAGDYEDARTRINQVADEFGATNPLQAKFALLNAMITGNVEGKEAYIAALKDVIAKYPSTPETIRAKEMLRLLAGDKAIAGGIGNNNNSNPNASNANTDNSRFKQEDSKMHYILVVMDDPETSLVDIKANISDYNTQYHKLDKLRISNIYLGAESKTPIVVIRRFKSKDLAMKYYEGVQGASDFIKTDIGFQILPITQNNYREVIKTKSLEGYKEFFELSYL